MTDADYPALHDAIHFHTPGRLSGAFPYRLQVAGHRSCGRSHAPIGQRFNHHTLIYTHGGAGLLRIGSTLATAPAGSIAWVDTSMRYEHACHPEAEAWNYLWMGLEGHGLDMLYDHLEVAGRPVFASPDIVGAAMHFSDVIAALRQKVPLLDSACSAIVARLLAIVAAERSDAHGEHSSRNRLLVVMQMVRSDLGRRWSVGDLSRIADLSGSQLFRQFRRHVGTTPLDWVRRERMNLAKQLLSATDMPVAAIASRCGYPDAFHFSRDFRRLVGVPPSGFRTAYARTGP